MSELREVKLEREPIKVRSVGGELLRGRDIRGARNVPNVAGGGKVGYVRLIAFTDGSSEELARVLRELADAGARSFVVDLRENSGGLVDVGLDVAGTWLGADVPAAKVRLALAVSCRTTCARVCAFECAVVRSLTRTRPPRRSWRATPHGRWSSPPRRPPSPRACPTRRASLPPSPCSSMRAPPAPRRSSPRRCRTRGARPSSAGRRTARGASRACCRSPEGGRSFSRRRDTSAQSGARARACARACVCECACA